MPRAPAPTLSHSLPRRTTSTSLVLYFPKKARSQPGPLLLEAAICPLVELESSGWRGGVSYLPNPKEDQLHPRKFGSWLAHRLPRSYIHPIMVLVCQDLQSVDFKGEIILFPMFCSQPTLVLLHDPTQTLVVLLSIFHLCLPP